MNCYVLTGGESRRMRRSKAELFLEHTIEVARPVFDEVISIDACGPGGERAAVFGVLHALEEATDRAFILAVDYPLMTTAALALIAAREGDLVIPEWDGVPQMLCGIYSTRLIESINGRIEQGRLDLRGLLDDAPGAIIPEHELRAVLAGEPLRNVNTPEDYERVQSSR